MEPIYRYCVEKNIPLTMHMGTTFAENAPVELGRPMNVDDVARRHPDLKMIMAHMAHPWVEECIVVARKNDNVYCEVSAIFYRPWQFWNALISAQEYRISERNKIFWGTDFPFSRADEHQPPGRGNFAAAGEQRDHRGDPLFRSLRALVAWWIESWRAEGLKWKPRNEDHRGRSDPVARRPGL
jgi:hypothetical protein